MPERRSADEIRRDIAAERRQFQAATQALAVDAKRTVRLVAIVVGAGVATLMVARIVRARRRRR